MNFLLILLPFRFHISSRTDTGCFFPFFFFSLSSSFTCIQFILRNNLNVWTCKQNPVFAIIQEVKYDHIANCQLLFVFWIILYGCMAMEELMNLTHNLQRVADERMNDTKKSTKTKYKYITKTECVWHGEYGDAKKVYFLTVNWTFCNSLSL